MKVNIVNFVSRIIRQREYLLKNGKSKKDQLKCWDYCKRVKANLIGRPQLTEVAAKKIFLKYQNEIFFLIPSGKNPLFSNNVIEFKKILNQCIS